MCHVLDDVINETRKLLTLCVPVRTHRETFSSTKADTVQYSTVQDRTVR
jgi:hypothetical protein